VPSLVNKVTVLESLLKTLKLTLLMLDEVSLIVGVDVCPGSGAGGSITSSTSHCAVKLLLLVTIEVNKGFHPLNTKPFLVILFSSGPGGKAVVFTNTCVVLVSVVPSHQVPPLGSQDTVRV
jgi:hypothetical protein